MKLSCLRLSLNHRSPVLWYRPCLLLGIFPLSLKSDFHCLIVCSDLLIIIAAYSAAFVEVQLKACSKLNVRKRPNAILSSRSTEKKRSSTNFYNFKAGVLANSSSGSKVGSLSVSTIELETLLVNLYRAPSAIAKTSTVSRLGPASEASLIGESLGVLASLALVALKCEF